MIFDLTLLFYSENFIPKKYFCIEKSNVGNHLKRVLPKFQAERSYFWGVNGRSKFLFFRNLRNSSFFETLNALDTKIGRVKCLIFGPAFCHITYVRTYVCTYIRTYYVRTHARTHARTHVRTYARTHARTHARTYVRACVRACVRAYVRTCVRACVRACVRT